MTAYDGVVLGAGHNGLILQAYLGMAGLKTVVLERRQIAGGGLSTLMEDPRFPGFLHNTHGFFQRAVAAMPWYRNLDLKARGVEYIEPELNVALLTRDGRALEWWTDFEHTAASFAACGRCEVRFQPPDQSTPRGSLGVFGDAGRKSLKFDAGRLIDLSCRTRLDQLDG